MKIELSQDEAQTLIACLAALEKDLHPDEPMARALVELRPMRTRLMEAWLRAGLNSASADEVSL